MHPKAKIRLDGVAVIDEAGEVLPGDASAREIAIRIISEMTPGKAPPKSGLATPSRLSCAMKTGRPSAH